MKKLGNLYPGQRFTWNGVLYTVLDHEGLMTEVSGNGRNWAWPSNANVSS